MKNDTKNILFGTINTKTGEMMDGFFDKNGKMKYKKQPWYKRIFQKPPIKKEYIGITQLYSRLIWSNKKNYFDAPVYKIFNYYTDEIVELYAITNRGKYHLNIDAYIKNKVLIPG